MEPSPKNKVATRPQGPIKLKVLEELLQATDATTSSEARLTEQKDVSGKVNDHKDVTDIVSNK